jgi:hypothetical protein
MLKFGGGMLLILLLVWGIAAITPKLAKVIDRIFGIKTKEEQQVSPENYKVRDPWMGIQNTEDRVQNTEENDLATESPLDDLKTASPQGDLHSESPQENDLDKKEI